MAFWTRKPCLLPHLAHSRCPGARAGTTEHCLSVLLNFVSVDTSYFHKCIFLKLCIAPWVRSWILELSGLNLSLQLINHMVCADHATPPSPLVFLNLENEGNNSTFLIELM